MWGGRQVRGVLPRLRVVWFDKRLATVIVLLFWISIASFVEDFLCMGQVTMFMVDTQPNRLQIGNAIE